MIHLLYRTGNRDFVAYNVGAFPMSDEPVTDADILPGRMLEWTASLAKCRSEAWSSDCRWFMLCQAEGIYLFNVDSMDFHFCRKQSHQFIHHFLKAK